MNEPVSEHVDFFISYNSADEDWAEWVAQTLDTHGYEVVLQKWDFRPGTNFVIGMDEAARRADRTILILSPASLESDYAAPEWAAAFVEDPRGSKAKLVPVRVEECAPTGLLKSIVNIDLVGLSGDQAQAELLAGVTGERRKPTNPVAFPGDTRRGVVAPAAAAIPVAAAQPAGWVSLDAPLPAAWHGVQQSGYRTHHGTNLEVHLVPTDGLRVEVRRLVTLKNELIDLGRRSGLFPVEAAANADQTSDKTYVEVHGDRQAVVAGLAVHRNGQRSGWFALPSDTMGAVFDADYLRKHMQEVISLLLQIDAPIAERYGVAVAITSPMMLTVGSVSVLGNRSSASMRGGTEDILIQAEDTVSSAYLRSATAEVAEEMVARLEATMRR